MVSLCAALKKTVQRGRDKLKSSHAAQTTKRLRSETPCADLSPVKPDEISFSLQHGDRLQEEPAGYGSASGPSPITVYLRRIEAAHQQGNDTEHTHRPALKALLEALDPRIVATNEPKRIACGAPDLVITRRKNGLQIGMSKRRTSAFR